MNETRGEKRRLTEADWPPSLPHLHTMDLPGLIPHGDSLLLPHSETLNSFLPSHAEELSILPPVQNKRRKGETLQLMDDLPELPLFYDSEADLLPLPPIHSLSLPLRSNLSPPPSRISLLPPEVLHMIIVALSSLSDQDNLSSCSSYSTSSTTSCPQATEVPCSALSVELSILSKKWKRAAQGYSTSISLSYAGRRPSAENSEELGHVLKKHRSIKHVTFSPNFPLKDILVRDRDFLNIIFDACPSLLSLTAPLISVGDTPRMSVHRHMAVTHPYGSLRRLSYADLDIWRLVESLPSTLTSLSINQVSNDVTINLDVIASQCPNLEKLSVRSSRYTNNCFGMACGYLKKLKALELFDMDIKDDILRSIANNIPTLEALRFKNVLSYSYSSTSLEVLVTNCKYVMELEMTGKHLHHLAKLKFLTIADLTRSKVTDDDIKDMLKRCRYLKRVYLDRCYKLTTDATVHFLQAGFDKKGSMFVKMPKMSQVCLVQRK
eukprot:TRINITY_DN4328_c0_g1_i1.p1 TRINITY_DN4328_c0_g1~~TRINITY_DN4328_c0_g1_i1.p1  ORF type:complete len:493 (-),score=41.07 TRINITY_DN4328_c0_g1_i1:102-1580(-)